MEMSGKAGLANEALLFFLLGENMGRLTSCYNIEDLRLAAQKRLPKGVFDYLKAGPLGFPVVPLV